MAVCPSCTGGQPVRHPKDSSFCRMELGFEPRSVHLQRYLCAGGHPGDVCVRGVLHHHGMNSKKSREGSLEREFLPGVAPTPSGQFIGNSVYYHHSASCQLTGGRGRATPQVIEGVIQQPESPCGARSSRSNSGRWYQLPTELSSWG